MDSDKKQLRSRLRQILAQIPEAVCRQKSLQICQYILDADEYKKASVIMAFLSMPREVDTTPILLDAWQRKKTVVVPQMDWEHKRMIPVQIHSLDNCSTDNMGLRNPESAAPVSPETIELVITPGLGFDRRGNRLGRGGAYYDRFFATPGLRALKWATAFTEQIMDAVPMDKTDVPVDALVCETGIIRCTHNVNVHGG
jgi:5-formyltetrahydrofolate cyclo-ligase